MPTVEDLALPETPAEAAIVERRREGRIDYSNPHLIDLLRRREFVEPVAPAEPEAVQVVIVEPPVQTTGPAATRYIVIASLCFWAVVAGTLWETMSGMR
jgi:hypothetical protein